MYRLTCPYGCKTEKTQQPRSFINEQTYKKHMQQFHSDKEPINEPTKEPIEDFQEKLNILTNEIKALKLDNEHLKSQYNTQSQLSSKNDLKKNEKINNLSNKVKVLKLSNEYLQSQLDTKSEIPSKNDLKTIKKIEEKKKTVQKNIENEINKKMIKDEDDDEDEDEYEDDDDDDDDDDEDDDKKLT